MSTLVNNDGSTIVTTFTSSGTWTKDDRSTMVTVIGWGGGGGGGSGRQGASTHGGGGAGGGAGGSFYFSCVPASFFGTTETVTIGLGGAGGAAVVTNDTDGNAGTSGGHTKFGYYSTEIGTALITSGIGPNNFGPGGNTGTTATAFLRALYTSGLILPGVTVSATPIQGVCPYSGAGKLGNGEDAAAAGGTYGRFLTATAGGGGGGADSGTEKYGGHGGKIFQVDDSTVLLQGGVGGLESSVINGTAGNDYLATGGIITGGTGGGGGGGQSVGASAGNGGKGGFPGGGGGGGGGSLNGTNSGAGGAGGDGYVIVIEHLI